MQKLLLRGSQYVVHVTFVETRSASRLSRPRAGYPRSEGSGAKFEVTRLRAGLSTYAVYGRRSHKMKQTQKIRVVSGRKRGGSVLARERKGSGSHSGEWRRALWRERESDVSHLHLGRSGRIFFLGVVEQLNRMRDRGIQTGRS